MGTGLAGGSAGATLAEQGYQVVQFCFQDSPRRAHSVAAQGGINAAKNYRNDGDSVPRLFYDTIKGGDFRSRESNVYRLAQISTQIIDQCVAQGVPFAREYGGLLDNRSFGGVQVSRTFYARGQTGQQLLLGAYQALARQIDAGNVEMHPRTEMLDLIVAWTAGPGASSPATWSPARSRPIWPTPWCWPPAATATSSTSRPTPRAATPPPSGGRTSGARTWPIPASPRSTRPASRRSGDAPEQAHPDERVAAQRRPDLGARPAGRRPTPRPDPRGRAGLLPRADLPVIRQPGPPRHRLPGRQEPVRRRAAASGPADWASTWTSATRSSAWAGAAVEERYGNLFDMYQRITGEDPYRVPMRIYSGHPLHDGRAVGRLRPADHGARAVRDRRGQLLRPRRQPARARRR